MNRIPEKCTYLLTAAVLSGLCFWIIGCQSSDSRNPTTAPTQTTASGEIQPKPDEHDYEPRILSPHPGDIFKISVDDLVRQDARRRNNRKYSDIAIYLSLNEQQAVLWTSRDYEFQILELKLTTKVPDDVYKRLKNGPFYREFPTDPRDPERARDRFFKHISSGPARLDADPVKRECINSKPRSG